jgi:hypothetical protein
MESEFDDSIIDQLLETAEDNKMEDEEDDELEIERKYYQKPDMSTDPVEGADFLQAFIQGMG